MTNYVSIISDLLMYLWVFILLINSFIQSWNIKLDKNEIMHPNRMMYLIHRRTLSAIYFVGAVITLAILGINT